MKTIWYVDATSSIHRDIRGQNKIYLYSITSHDNVDKKFVNISDFLTTCHTSKNLIKFFREIFDIYLKSNMIVALIVITDFSWTLIISIMRAANYCDILHYLHWTLLVN